MPKVICPFCKKEYTSQEKYNTHQLVCDIVHNKKEEIQYSSKEITKMIISLCIKVDKLEKENKEIKNILNTIKVKKVNTLEKLNQTYKLEENIFDLLKLCIQNINIEFISKIADTSLVLLIIQLIVTQIKSKSNFPPFYYCRERQELYIYSTEWKAITTEIIKTMIKQIQNKLIHVYFEWKKEKESENKTNNLEELSTNILIKISLIHDEKYKIKKKLTTYIKEICNDYYDVTP
jgi:hypothetical protein